MGRLISRRAAAPWTPSPVLSLFGEEWGGQPACGGPHSSSQNFLWFETQAGPACRASWLGVGEGERGPCLQCPLRSASKAPGREMGKVLSCKGPAPRPSQSREEGPVPCTVPVHHGLWQMLPINRQVASIHLQHCPPPQESGCSCPASHPCMPLLSHLTPRALICASPPFLPLPRSSILSSLLFFLSLPFLCLFSHMLAFSAKWRRVPGPGVPDQL